MNCLKSIFIISLLVYSTGYVNSQCGNPTFKPIVASRIVNGQIAVANSFPWMVSLRQRFFSIFVSNHLCGGSLISNRHILTAAHCVTGLRPDQILAFAGIRNLTQVSSSTPLLVESITLHPSFNMSLANRGHDIAIIKLSRNITFSSTVQPICLPTSSSQSVLNRKLVLTGWGSTNGKAGVADLSNVLRQATLTVSQSKLCSSFFPYDSSRILCAIDANTTRNNNSKFHIFT